MQYGFIGLGNMATAIIKGMTTKGGINGDSIRGYDISAERMRVLGEDYGVFAENSVEQLAKVADTLILAVKPQVLQSLLQQLKPYINKDMLIISIAAGKDIAFLEQYLGNDLPIIRVMPNINAKVGAATCCFSVNSQVNAAHKQIVQQLFATIGSISELPEHLFSAFTAICGSSPAFTYMYIDALAKAAVKAGMPRQQALQLAADGVYGSAAMILQSGEHPGALVDQVCSPGGTTIDGVLCLDELGFCHAVHQAVEAVIEKDKKLSGK